jgi:hypothetical protein
MTAPIKEVSTVAQVSAVHAACLGAAATFGVAIDIDRWEELGAHIVHFRFWLNRRGEGGYRERFALMMVLRDGEVSLVPDGLQDEGEEDWPEPWKGALLSILTDELIDEGQPDLGQELTPALLRMSLVTDRTFEEGL